MPGLDWQKARRDSTRARERAEARAAGRSGQRAPIRTDVKRTTVKQRSFIRDLERELELPESVLPPFSWQARNRIEHLLTLKRRRT